jgi:succinate dehydrogenase / fumarate reductase membrane anchor subunit
MVKSVLGVNHQGLQDWLIQRVSAVVMAVYSVGIIAYLLINYPVDFVNWH